MSQEGRKEMRSVMSIAVAVVCVGTAVGCFAGPDFPISDYGAREGDDVTAAVEAAMAACERAGGGRVVIPKGAWLTGAVRLRSNCELHLADGARLEFSDDPSRYLPAVQTAWEGIECYNHSPLVSAFGATNIAICGAGVLTARTAGWEAWRVQGPLQSAAQAQLMDWGRRDVPVEERDLTRLAAANRRPPFIGFNRCRGVRLEGFALRNSPFWCIHMLHCENVVLRRLDVFARGSNTDGANFESTRHALVEDCVFDQGDDVICCKSGRDRDGRRRGVPTEDVVVRRCLARGGHGLFTMGSELSGGIRNVMMEDCRVTGALWTLLNVKTRPTRGGFVENVVFRRIRAEVVSNAMVHVSTRNAKWAHLEKGHERMLTRIDGITVEDVYARRAGRVINVQGDPDLPLRNLTVRKTAAEVADMADAVENAAVTVVTNAPAWEDQTRLSEGRLPPRAWFGSFPDVESARAILPEKSPRRLSLDSESEWRFHWSRRPSERPVGFEQPTFDVSGWPVVKVPCSWQAMGIRTSGERFGTPIYVNHPYIFTSKLPADATCWPRVTGLPVGEDWTFSAEDNPVGSYRRDVTVPAERIGDDLILQFDGVESFFNLWVNGTYVGFSKNSRSPAAFDVTRLLHAGTNTVAVEVYRNSDGSYLECQDIFRLSGIMRSVSLTRRPKTRLRDVRFTTKPVRKGDYDGDWVLDLSVETRGEADVKARVFAADGRTIPATVGRTVFARPTLWSAEAPNLYTLVVSVEKDGRCLEAAGFQVGFREVEIREAADPRERTFLFNGQPIKLNGVNRGETDPLYGHYVPRERLEEDLRLIKRGNFNHIRNSHFPQEGAFYHFCNKYGLYVMDEANLESHGTRYEAASLSNEKSWEAAHVERQASMYEWNKNFPCIVIWSMGNEAGPGDNFKTCYRYLKEKDPTRPVQYERNPWLTDMGSRQYPSVEWMRRCAAGDPTLTDGVQTNRPVHYPYHVNEYAHNFNNGCGNLADFQAAIESSTRIMGGGLWDFADQSLWMTWKGRRVAAWGGCFGEKPEEGQGMLDGLVTGDRRTEPSYDEIRYVFRPFAARLEGGRLALVSKRFFRDSSDCICRWTLLRDGVATERGTFDVVLGPRETRIVELPEAARSRTGRGERALRIEFVQKAEEGAVPAGWTVAADQVALGGVAEPPPALPGGLAYGFSPETGELVSLKRDGRELLKSPMTLDCFRVPVGGETKYRENRMSYGRERLLDGLRVMCPKKRRFEDRRLPDGRREVVSVIAYRGARKEDVPRLGHVNENGIDDLGPLPDDAPGVEVTNVWTIGPSGVAHVRSTFCPTGRNVEFPRMGWRFVFNLPHTQVDYFACGPYDNYSDRKAGAFPARYRGDSANFGFAFTTSQDNGTREEARFVTLTDVGLSFAAPAGRRFAFAVSPYSPTEMLCRPHPECLPAPSKTEFGLYARVRGLGSNNCGPLPLARDILAAGETCELEFELK